LDFSSIRQTTNNQFVPLSPQYPTSLTFNYTQPLFRGLRFDNNRRQIEIAKKNLSLTDAQFRQRAIETITSVQRAYWDLVFALRNLQVQRDAVRDSRQQLEEPDCGEPSGRPLEPFDHSNRSGGPGAARHFVAGGDESGDGKPARAA